MTTAQKKKAYQQAIVDIDAVLNGEQQYVLKMATINCLLKQYLPYYFWVGFYCVHEEGLIVGPYQGTLGCLHISFQKGICGRAARTKQTQIVYDVHADSEHIACDSRTQSEIVVPVLNAKNDLIAVLDVDSTELGSFDEIDQHYLEQIIQTHFKENALEMQYSIPSIL